jgi:NTP pyrophosphatase (non-canonical NTP hydrolase)
MNDALTFAALTAANLRRLPLFRNRLGEIAHSKPDGSDWNLAEWTNAVAGETGEACNIAKKIQRGDFGPPGTEPYAQACRELAKELADIVIYADIACMRAGWSLGYIIADKFNEVSDRVGCSIKL